MAGPALTAAVGNCEWGWLNTGAGLPTQALKGPFALETSWSFVQTHAARLSLSSPEMWSECGHGLAWWFGYAEAYRFSV